MIQGHPAFFLSAKPQTQLQPKPTEPKNTKKKSPNQKKISSNFLSVLILFYIFWLPLSLRRNDAAISPSSRPHVVGRRTNVVAVDIELKEGFSSRSSRASDWVLVVVVAFYRRSSARLTACSPLSLARQVSSSIPLHHLRRRHTFRPQNPRRGPRRQQQRRHRAIPPAANDPPLTPHETARLRHTRLGKR
ncbi:hypothetical protein B0H11DRAFT_1260744 [Mycena galericulata]|nr:hypothetical protein B0H11DRAFT_1260744 [Mycena galericulata]